MAWYPGIMGAGGGGTLQFLQITGGAMSVVVTCSEGYIVLSAGADPILTIDGVTQTPTMEDATNHCRWWKLENLNGATVAWDRGRGELVYSTSQRSILDFLPSLDTGEALRMDGLYGLGTAGLSYVAIPTDTTNAWGRVGSSDVWAGIANVKGKTKVIRTSNSYAPVAYGITVNSRSYTLTQLSFSNNIADCSAYDYVLISCINATSSTKIYFE